MYTIISQNTPQGEWKLMFTREQEIEEFLDEYRRSRVIIESTVRATLIISDGRLTIIVNKL